ncbi:ketoacyl-ACP synthase III [Cohnella faecalis]|uniref:Beta-ketoacyl-[acyl-carrier-protein] synthase III n=1 Tax=Cohnella faecalis TaxID=2315694 RepID=A0A398CL06_9BACL|nr:ketoacyl-ACP synthase III [Cohnella faecalis]RIE02872.1 ketoacyl-ACP synthase III [Cohnella faecalis]
MPLQSNSTITAIGSFVPSAVITNEDLERMVDTNDEWIVRRTGIQKRHRAADDEFTSHLAIAAVRDLIDRYRIDIQGVDGIIVATTTPDMPFPSVASRIQHAFGMNAGLAIDLNAACAGFVAALQLANGLLLSGANRKVLVIGAETLTKITDYSDRSTCILLGDGAGAVLVEAGSALENGAFLASYARTDGSGGKHVYCSGLSDRLDGEALAGEGHMVQNGREVYKWAVTQVPQGVQSLLDQAGVSLQQLDWLVPHSANLRMIEAICERLSLPSERALESVIRNGNTSAASIPLALDAAVRDGRLQPGHLLALYGFGAGLTQAGLLLRWTIGG